jgi:ABC-type lipoprotein release transport system permease subunit
MAAIGLGYAMLLFVACLMAGLRQQMIESGTGLVLSDIEIHAPGYYPDRSIHKT